MRNLFMTLPILAVTVLAGCETADGVQIFDGVNPVSDKQRQCAAVQEVLTTPTVGSLEYTIAQDRFQELDCRSLGFPLVPRTAP